MQKVFGPFSGYRVVVRVAESSESQGSFSAFYKICADAPGDTSEAKPEIRKRVEGFFGSIDEAFDIALQLARLRVAGLHARTSEAAAPEEKGKSTLAEFARSWLQDPESDSHPIAYQPTLPCPLLPMASRRS